MRRARILSLAILAVWLGGLVTLGAIGAPTIFDVLESLDPVGGRDAAGRVFGAIFERFQHAAWLLGTLLLAILGLRAAVGPRPRRWGLRVGVVTAMLAASALTTLVIAPRIEAIRDASPEPVAALPDSDPRRMSFGRLHGLSTGLMLVTVVAGAWLFWADATDEA